MGFYLASFGEGYIPLMRLRLIIGNAEVWADQLTIERRSRKLGLAADLKRSTYAEFKRRGIETIFAASRSCNKASLESAQKFGIQKAFRFNYIKVFACGRVIYRRIQANSAGFSRRGFFTWLADPRTRVLKAL